MNKEIIKKLIKCKSDFDCKNTPCNECNYYVPDEDVLKALEEILKEIDND